MVDRNLPNGGDRKLRYLFLDFNSYFASVEQQERPELRGRPVAVAPVMAETSFVIAASYEAKAFGVKTGTMIRTAREMCPGIEIVHARPKVYVAYHRRILEVAEDVLPIDEVCSIDEMRFRLLGEEREPTAARALGQRMKDAILTHVGERMRCSVGIAPNAYLAKIATELMKPDGLVVLERKDLPHALHRLKLTDLTGINRRTQVRLNAAGIFSVEQLCAATESELRRAFGGVLGERFWHRLRGEDLKEEVRKGQSLGHSHVLAPELRTDDGCREVLLRLLHKAAARLRSHHLWAGSMTVYVSAFEKSWEARAKLPPTQDSITMTEQLNELWKSRDFRKPRSVGVTFHDLRSGSEVTPSLFSAAVERAEMSRAVDAMNQKFGKNSIFLAGMHRAKDTAEEKIAFNKTWLFDEGREMEDGWVDTFRGLT